MEKKILLSIESIVLFVLCLFLLSHHPSTSKKPAWQYYPKQQQQQQQRTLNRGISSFVFSRIIHQKKMRCNFAFSNRNNDIWTLENEDKVSVDDERNGELLDIKEDSQDDTYLRFSGVARLYRDTQQQEQQQEQIEDSSIDTILHRLSNATVAIIGLGGVGSWAAEALCRSGIGNLILIDMDDICISNTNRQLHATSSTIGQMKIHQMKRRLIDINPQCNVTTILDFITVDNVNQIINSLLPNVTICLDAVDGHFEKTALIATCCQYGLPIITCGGAGGKVDPTKIIYNDLTKVEYDRLLSQCRSNLRRQYGFKKGPEKLSKGFKPKRWNVTAIFSTEVQKSPLTGEKKNGENDENIDVVVPSSFRRCDNGSLGTACFVTGTYGFVAAKCIVDMIALDKLLVPTSAIGTKISKK